MTQGPDPALARPLESHSELRETWYPYLGPVSAHYYLKVKKLGVFAKVQCQKSRVTKHSDIQFKSGTRLKNDFPSSTQSSSQVGNIDSQLPMQI